ncbi:MAG: hypothetical protein KF833_06450 [Verrucomicrobiae bacterium]|nr:hypothetical protein [Verrucomicrobiae bacterium]
MAKSTIRRLHFCLLLFCLVGCRLFRPADNNPGHVFYEISGSIRLVNDCDGRQASLPDKVTVFTVLETADGRIGVNGSVTVPLQTDPVAPFDPVMVGFYRLSVRWPVVAGNPVRWTAPILITPGRRPPPTVRPPHLNHRRICGQLICPDGTGTCRNVVAEMPVPATTAPHVTLHDLIVVCACN